MAASAVSAPAIKAPEACATAATARGVASVVMFIRVPAAEAVVADVRWRGEGRGGVEIAHRRRAPVVRDLRAERRRAGAAAAAAATAGRQAGAIATYRHTAKNPPSCTDDAATKGNESRMQSHHSVL